MRRISQQTVGGLEVLELQEDASRPVPAAGEVLIQTRAIGVNPVDAKIRAGSGLLGDPPFTLGFDVSGVVVESQDDRFAPGDEVFGMIRFPHEGATYAEYVSAPADQLLRKPPMLSHNEAAAVPLAAETAWQALIHAGRLRANDRVLIHAGAGGVGLFAIQIAKAQKAHVITTSTEAKHDFLRAFGADEMFDYRDPDYAAPLAGTLDVVLDTVGAGTAETSIPALKPGGRLITIVDYRSETLPQLAEAARIEYHGVRVTPNAADLQQIVNLIEAGSFEVELAAVLALEDAAIAHHLIETGRTTGKVVLVP
jgi:NADPH:quinone reductase-like Zn-dependent oxidoreductase